MPRYKVLIAQFPFGNQTHIDTAMWVTDVVLAMRDDKRIGRGNVHLANINDTPVSMSRNRALVQAEENDIDFVLMVDSDMRPDCRLQSGATKQPEGVRPFWQSSWEFLLEHKRTSGPAVVAAPYCGPPPHENVYVFQWENFRSDNPSPDFSIAQYTRSEAMRMRGIRRAASLPTGVTLIDMEAVRPMRHPRFYYEWTDHRATHKASTEDVVFYRDLAMRYKVPAYCNWDAWAIHHKSVAVQPPTFVNTEDYVRAQVLEGMDFYARFREDAEVDAARAQEAGPPVTVKWADGSVTTNGMAADSEPARNALAARPISNGRPRPGKVRA